MDEKCVVFTNESEIRLKEGIEGERYEEISNFQSKMIIQCN